MKFVINPWHKASPATQHLLRQALSKNSSAGNPDCIVSVSYVHHGSPKVEISFENGPTTVFDMSGFASTMKLFYKEVSSTKEHCFFRRMLKDDDWDDLEDSSHLTIDDFLKDLAESRRAEFGEFDDAFDAAWASNDPVQIEAFRQRWMPNETA